MKVEWKKILEQIAPAIAGVLGGPAAAMGVKVLSQAILGRPDGTEKEVGEAIIANADPELLAKIKAADQAFAIRLEEIGLDYAKLTVEEKKSARELFKTNIWPQIALSALYVLGYFAVLTMLLTGRFQPAADIAELVKTLIASLGAVVLIIMQFWFGTSLGSARKTDALAMSMPANGNGGTK